MSLSWEVDEVAWFWLSRERKVIGWAADMFFWGRMLKAREKQGEGGPGEAERRDDGRVDRGGCGFEERSVMYPSSPAPDIYVR